jgi:hypothetical protein
MGLSFHDETSTLTTKLLVEATGGLPASETGSIGRREDGIGIQLSDHIQMVERDEPLYS